MTENQIASVWYIDGNNLKHSNKVIVRLNYNGLDIAVLKEDLNYNYQEFLIKDSNNEYWALGIAPIKFKKMQHKKEEVEKTNTIFRKQLKEMKYKIFIGEDVPIDEFEFYKDDKYENGKTIQNSILYLAKEYGIKIPLATQGFINNRLVNYNFRTGEFAYKLTNNKKASVKMHEYLRQIFEKVKEEYKQLKKEREAR